ncbi:hypothetical protein GCM10009017_11490 [Halarchaeum rubridurum]|nr:hypothetical protein GCM10009017_11490 [Halarchaeum rubridurum]
MTSLSPMAIAGTINHPRWSAALDQGFYADRGLDVTPQYKPFPAQIQAVSGGSVATALESFLPYLGNVVKGQDLVTFGFQAGLQSINALYVRADSDYETIEDLKGERIGVWSFGSSTVQAFEALMAERTGLNLRKDFETTTAAPPALIGLLDSGKIDAVIDVSSLTIKMEAQPEKYRNIVGLNEMWLNQSGHTLPLTSWWCTADWYENNTDVAAAMVEASKETVQYWRDNTTDILQQWGEPASITTDAQIDVVDEMANEGHVFRKEQSQEFVDSTWEFAALMQEHGYIDSVPAQDDVLKNPV